MEKLVKRRRRVLMSLVRLSPGQGLEIQLAYATDQNFTGQVIYQHPFCFLHETAAPLLEKARHLARAQGLGLLVFDAFRPTEAQERLWQHTPNPDYVTDPRKGSPHSRGIAVDLTLVSLETGAPLDMGSEFDDLSVASHHGCGDISPEAQKNRYLLLGLMMSAGWDCYLKEWWHYQLFNPRMYPLLCDGEAAPKMMSS